MSINLDRKINNIENKLSEISYYPVVGTLAGCAKIALGIIQTVTAIACGILLILPSALTKDASLLKYCWSHVQHGLGNIICGFVEAIPIIQSIAYGCRVCGRMRNMDENVCIYTGHENKCMPYASLEANDWHFGGTGIHREDILNVEQVYSRKILENGGAANLSPNRRFQLAKEAVRERNQQGAAV